MARRTACGATLPLLAGVLLLAACGSPTSPGSPGATPSGTAGPTAPAEPTTTATSAPEGQAARPAAIPQPVWDALLADLDTRTGRPAADVSVVTAEAVTWNDGSLGCPEPGMVYTQALVDGYHVVLDVGGQEYDYRVGAGTAVKLCTSRTTP